MKKMIIMKSKLIILSLFVLIFALFIVSNVSAIDNETIIGDNSTQSGEITSDLEFEQSFDHKTVKKSEIFEVYLTVKNNGLEAYHNLSIFYPLPKGLNLLIYPNEYNNQSWFIDSLYPSESSTLTLVCQSLIDNTSYDFVASYGGTKVSEAKIFCEPENHSNNTPDNNQGIVDVLKSVNSGDIELKNTANPIFLLLFTLIFIPYIRFKY